MTSHPGHPIDTEYDIIVAGGGTAGCVVAGRLAAADPALKVLILEAGPDTKDKMEHIQPARYLQHLHPNSLVLCSFTEPPSDALGGRSMGISTGQCLGGGSSINFAVYSRASASDYDDWESVYKNPGWGSKNLIPLLRKVETYQIKEDAETHRYNGPLKVSYGGIFTNVGRQCLEVAKALDQRRDGGPDADLNDTVSVNKYGRWQKWIDAKTGRRSDVPHHFIYNQSSNPNLQYATGVHVKRVTLTDGRATGVEFTWNSRFHPAADRKVHTVRASRMVLLSAGTWGSPGILERSGIGSAEILKRVDIPVKVDLPGVGNGYQDHNLVFIPYKAADEADTLDAIARGDEDALKDETATWLQTGGGIMAHNGIDGGVKLRPFADELPAFGSEFKEVWDGYYATAPDKPLLWVVAEAMLVTPEPRAFPARKYYSMGYFSMYPMARGHVHITDGDAAAAPVDFRSGYMESMADVTYKYTREIARRMPLFRGEVESLHPPFAEDSQAKIIASAEGPVSMNAERIVYTKEDEEVLERHVRRIVSTPWHSLGACAMKPRGSGGVVDSKLNVYGVTGLKIADMSIAPGNVGSNTYSTAVMIGEKAALIIGEELGIKGV